ncbi:nidogen-like domain-containing protein [Flavisolibacter ginsenosidimutans]|uniref:CHRD domain-containing protein n=1 Tax=Flavisolibacter ginsenosidimutans TaxID=661481 RepID=A0A5B8UPE7_9BACT|nr:nidogen-like domain-containing protein [Flavisolibacter ginsenosidimutans]QEC58109.1 CHRD domain-containing protein [Flavisolibacter ginsenosidimutans]
MNKRYQIRAHSPGLTSFKAFLFIGFFLVSSVFLKAAAQVVTDPSSDPNYDKQKAALINVSQGKTVQKSKTAPMQKSAAPSVSANALATCYFPPDNTYSSVPANDDGFVGPITLPFTFKLYGASYNQVYINNNGNITFDAGVSQYTADGFPFNVPMVAAFWADVDTRTGNLVRYKVNPTNLIVTFPQVGYYSTHLDKLNTFQIIITNGNDPLIGVGNNVAFYYDDMQWTTGDASGGSGGFGGGPATVGINKGNSVDYVQVGRFGIPGSAYDGGGGAIDGVDYLDGKCFTFNVTGELNNPNLPPSVSGAPANNTLNLACGETQTLTLQFLPPEINQLVSTTINTGGLCNVSTSISNGAVSTASVTITGAACNAGSHVISFTATDNFSTPASTTVNITVNVAACVNVGPVYYSKPTGDLHNLLTWGLNTDGSGANPSDFGDSTFQLANRSSGLYTMTGDWSVGGIINIPSGSQLQINGNTLSLTELDGAGTISGSNTSNLAVIGSSGGNVTLNFTGGSNTLNNFTVNRSGSNATATLGNALNVLNVLTLTTGRLNTGGMLTLKSSAANTARVAPVTGSISGDVTVERFIPARRAWRILSAPVGGISSGAASGQANLTNSQETAIGPLLRSDGSPRPQSFGTATFSLNEARTAMTMTATVFNIDITGTQTPDPNDNLVAAHIHVGAPPGSNASVRWGFFGTPDNDINPKQLVVTPFASGVGGTFTSIWDLPEGNGGTTLATNLPGILAGLSYINFHTVQFGGGEIRGQITMVGPGTQTINQAWQEGAILGLSANPNPAPGYGTHITGGPTYGSTANGFDQNPGAASSIKRYSSILNNWEALQNTNATFVGADAYMTFVRGDRGIPIGTNDVPPTVTTLRAKGPLRIGDQTFNVAATGFTAIPNPYASPINFATITRNGVQNNFYLWDPKMGGINGVGAYVLLSDNGAGGYDIVPAPVSPESQYIQSGQGFLVRPATNGVSGSITIKESDKSATPAMDVFRANGPTASIPVTPLFADPSSGQGLRVQLQTTNADGGVNILDEVFASYRNTYAEKIDGLDAVKMENVEENVAIIREGQTFMVERKPLPKENDVISLKLWNTKAQTYVFEINPVHLAGTGLFAFVEDKYLKTVTPVSLEVKSKVSFSITNDPASARSDRFQIILTHRLPDVLTKVSDKSNITAYPNPVHGHTIQLAFVNKEQGLYSVEIINGSGQVVLRKNLQHSGGTVAQTLELSSKLSAGAYQLRVSGKGGSTTVPLLIN